MNVSVRTSPKKTSRNTRYARQKTSVVCGHVTHLDICHRHLAKVIAVAGDVIVAVSVVELKYARKRYAKSITLVVASEVVQARMLLEIVRTPQKRRSNEE